MPLQNAVDFDSISHVPGGHNGSRAVSAIGNSNVRGWESGHSEMAAYSTFNETLGKFRRAKLRLARASLSLFSLSRPGWNPNPFHGNKRVVAYTHRDTAAKRICVLAEIAAV